jgi:hypothetical protein
MDRLRSLSDRLPIPGADRGVEEFHHIGTKKLRGNCGWYLDSLIALRGHTAIPRDMMRGLPADLRPHSPPGA